MKSKGLSENNRLRGLGIFKCIQRQGDHIEIRSRFRAKPNVIDGFIALMVRIYIYVFRKLNEVSVCILSNIKLKCNIKF